MFKTWLSGSVVYRVTSREQSVERPVPPMFVLPGVPALAWWCP